MKQTKTKLLCLLIAALMLLSLAACGKETATLDFTNNGKENASYLWSVDETVMQNGVELEVASIITNYDTFETVIDNQFKEVAPGATLEVKTAFVLSDTTSEIKATFEELLGSKKGTITIDPSTLKRETAANTEPEATLPAAAATGDALLDWWNGEWYGWWQMTGCSGYYENMRTTPEPSPWLWLPSA